MPNNQSQRVLNRMGATELTMEELEKVTGNGKLLNTFASNTGTGSINNPDSDFDQ